MFKKGGFIALFVGIFGLGLMLAQPTWAAATISGTVTRHSDGAAIPNLYMLAENASTGVESSGWTDAAGAYSITVDAGTYVVYDSYISSADFPNYVFRRGTQTVTVVDGETASINFSLIAQGRILGKVYAGDGVTPIYNAYIYGYNSTGSSYGSYGAYSTAIGQYYFTPYPSSSDYTVSAAGTYNMTISKTGYFTKQITTGTTIVDEQDTSLDITLTDGSTISGQVLDANGAPISGATVTAVKSGGTTYTGTTDSSGQYTAQIFDTYPYNGTAVGTYTVTASKSGYISYAKALTIEEDGTAATKNYTLQLGGTITGYTYKKNGTTPLETVTISATDGLGNTYTTTSGADGFYSITSLRPSTSYTITFSKTYYVTQVLYNVEVSLGATTADQNASIPAASEYSGTVLDADGAAIYGAYVYLYNLSQPRSSSSNYSGTTSSDGSFTITGITPNYYRIMITKTGYVAYEKSKINLKDDVSGKDYTLTDGAEIFGRVTYNGNPVKGAYVYAYSGKRISNQGYDSATTDNDGYYRFSELKKGTYNIRVSSSQYAEKIVAKKIKAGKQKRVNIKLSEAGSFSGYIYDNSTNLPLSGYVVRIKGSGMSATSDSNGYYVFDGIAAGKYKPYVASTYYETASASIRVKAGKDTDDVNFGLTSK
ncbi:MAG: carboxypeptidase regulatory-like domain-containing protein [Patescibacteria group bacterium]|jgi:hypothetical protein